LPAGGNADVFGVDEYRATLKIIVTFLKIYGRRLKSKHNYRVEQRKRMFFRWLVHFKGGVDDVGRELADSSDNAVSVAMAHWNVQHRVLAVEQFFRNIDSVVTVQQDEKHAFPLLHSVY
jgi:hypothetical protein